VPRSGQIRLIVWDETDERVFGNHERYEGDIVKFYAFYGTGKKPVRSDDIKCEIKSKRGTREMTFDKKRGLYWFQMKAREAGMFPWSVKCGGGDYPILEEHDEIDILSVKEDLYRQLLAFKKTYDFEKDVALTKKKGAYPRLVNHFMISGKILDENYKGVNLNRELASALSKWDLVSPSLYNIRKFNLDKHLDIIKMIKEFNPNTKLLMYLPGGNFPINSKGVFSDEITQNLSGKGWLVRTPGGESFPPHGDWKLVQYTLDGSASFMADFIADKIEQYRFFDGVWLDLMRGERVISKWFEEKKLNIDMDRDGVNDLQQHGANWAINQIQKGYASLFKNVRMKLGDDKIIIGNPGVPWEINKIYDDSEMFKYANGNMQEGAEGVYFVVKMGVKGALLNAEHAYSKPEQVFIIHLENTDPDTLKRQEVRYALTMTLMTDAYFSYDSYDLMNGGHRYHNQIYWWPEYNVDLGFPKSGFTIKEDPRGRKYYLRSFDKGVVIGNNGRESVKVSLGEDYINVSTGLLASSFEIAPKDGMILVSRSDK